LNQVLVLVLKLRVKTFVSRLRLLTRDAIPTVTPLETGLDCALETPDIGLEITRIVFRLNRAVQFRQRRCNIMRPFIYSSVSSDNDAL